MRLEMHSIVVVVVVVVVLVVTYGSICIRFCVCVTKKSIFFT